MEPFGVSLYRTSTLLRREARSYHEWCNQMVVSSAIDGGGGFNYLVDCVRIVFTFVAMILRASINNHH